MVPQYVWTVIYRYCLGCSTQITLKIVAPTAETAVRSTRTVARLKNHDRRIVIDMLTRNPEDVYVV